MLIQLPMGSCYEACIGVRSLTQCIRSQLVINEVSESSPQALQAVKLLAQYFGEKIDKVWRARRLPPANAALADGGGALLS